MEIVHEIKMDITIVDTSCESGDLPLRQRNIKDVETILKALWNVDDLHITSLQSFENRETSDVEVQNA